MKKKILATLLVLAMALNLTVLSGCGKKTKDTGDYVTRGEWLSMLAESFGLDFSDSDTPYFKDIPAGHELFSAVQGLGDWDILAPLTGETLTADKLVTQQEVAATAAIAAGFKVRDDFQPEQAVQFAAQYGILDADGSSITKEECEAVLEAAQNVYLENPGEEKQLAVFNKALIDLTELPSGAIQPQEDGTVIISRNVTNGVYQGGNGQIYCSVNTPSGEVHIGIDSTFITAPTSENPQGVAYKATSLTGCEDGSVIVQTQSPDIGDIYDDLEVHTTVSLDQGTITWAEGVTVTSMPNTEGLSATANEYHIELLANQTKSAGEKISLGATHTFSLGAKPIKALLDTPEFIKDANTARLLENAGYSYIDMPGIHHFSGNQTNWERALEKRAPFERDFTVSGSFTLDVSAITDIEYHKLNILNHEICTWPENASLVINASFSGDLKVEGKLAGEYELGKISIPIGTTGLYVTGSLFLFFDANGSLQIKVKAADQRRVSWSIKGDSGGYRADNAVNRGVTVQVAEPTINASFGAGVSANLCVLSDLRLVGAKVKVGGDIECTASVVGESQETEEDGIATRTCTEAVRFHADLYAPIVSLTISGPEHLSDILGLEKEWQLWGKEQATSWSIWDQAIPFWSQTVTVDAEGNMIGEVLAPTSSNTYTTQWSREYGNGEPPLSFSYPDGWRVASEGVADYSEEVVLTNERGAQVVYQYMPGSYAITSMTLHFSRESDISQIADLNFDGTKPLMVAKVIPKRNRYTNADGTQDVTEFPGNSFFYAVVPKSVSGVAWRGTYEDDSFEHYDGYVQFTAQGADLTAQETQEVIQILSSLRINAGAISSVVTADPVLAALQRGDFSEFAGTYKADQEYAQIYDCYAPDIILNSDGTLSGGGMIYSWDDSGVPPETPSKSAPVDIRADADGAGTFRCVFWERASTGEPGSKGEEYYTIYPVNVPDYRADDSSKVRIHYVCASGGVWDMWYTKAD